MSHMSDRIFYFAYGSNMAIERLRRRVPSAELISIATLPGHALSFHKPGRKDGSGKCDAASTGNSDDCVFGALYSIQASQLRALDRAEGLGDGYIRKTVIIKTPAGESLNAETYFATVSDARLRPLDWYKEHVLRGARAIGLPPLYVASIEAVVADIDPDDKRRASELAIYD